jgi:hypothetical protein
MGTFWVVFHRQFEAEANDNDWTSGEKVARVSGHCISGTSCWHPTVSQPERHRRGYGGPLGRLPAGSGLTVLIQSQDPVKRSVS